MIQKNSMIAPRAWEAYRLDRNNYFVAKTLSGKKLHQKWTYKPAVLHYVKFKTIMSGYKFSKSIYVDILLAAPRHQSTYSPVSDHSAYISDITVAAIIVPSNIFCFSAKTHFPFLPFIFFTNIRTNAYVHDIAYP